MGYFISFLVAVKDNKTNEVIVKHFHLGKDPEQDAIQYIKENYPDLLDVSENFCGDDECCDPLCDCDKSLYLLETRIQKQWYHCLDPSCQCVFERGYREPMNIDRSIRKSYKNERVIISIYYQMVDPLQGP